MPRKADPPAPALTAPGASLVQEMEAFEGDPDFMTSLARGLAVIRAFDAAHTKLTVAQASERSGLPRSAVRRCLYTLECLGYLASEGSFFQLRPRIVALGHVYLTALPLPQTAQPTLDRVAREAQETSTLAILDQDDILFVAHSSRTPLVSVNIAVGSRLPAYCTANGQVLLAALPAEEVDGYLARAKLSRITAKTLTTKKQLLERLRQVREDGYALVDQEFNDKVRSIAMAVRSGGNVVASMSFAVPADRVSAAQLKTRLLPLLRNAVAEFA